MIRTVLEIVFSFGFLVILKIHKILVTIIFKMSNKMLLNITVLRNFIDLSAVLATFASNKLCGVKILLFTYHKVQVKNQ